MQLEARALFVRNRLHEVDFAPEPGRVTAILGCNGAGKSTLLTAMAGLLPGRGTNAVRLDGRLLARWSARDRARIIGYLPQSAEVAWNLSVRTLAGLGRLPHRAGLAVDEQAVAAALKALDLTHLADRAVHTLSGGERARALLARVLAGEPHWILADEPVASLDMAQARALLLRLRALAHDEGRGVLVVLHDLAQAMNHADAVIVLDHGVVVAQGPPEQALTAGLIRMVWGVDAQWLGEPGARALAVGEA
ncbi:ABC transporter ATP-binding protein [Novosphingobium sp. FKTRR1]|uniref:ABC transporter ATP-binding protein n=1 Tax=Novosphingobium sp. FKTRR1 TaxID=2879118 RepID=UPI001CF0671E|nr:ABC transporter ATP-binding protein [Novosphingobium sp. FKTRR1]